MWFGKILVFFGIFVWFDGCEGATNAVFNEQIRDFSEDNSNLTDVTTLQNKTPGLARYASVPVHTIRFKDVPDNAISGSSYGRGLLQHDSNGYAYEDPHYDHGYEFQHDHTLHIPHDYHHQEFHDDHHAGHHGYGHHHKYYDPHALAAKTILWPIAGLALLGAAAALVTNPVLLQLGVVSGRKKRQVENMDFVKDSIKKWTPKSPTGMEKKINIPEFMIKRRRIIKNDTVNHDYAVEESNGEINKVEHKSDFKILKVLSKRHTNDDKKIMVPVPLKFKDKEPFNNVFDYNIYD